MSARALMSSLRQSCEGARQRLDALPARERALMVALVLATPLLLEWLWVWPLHQKRVNIADSIVAGRAEAEAIRESEQQSALQVQADLETSLQRQESELQRLGHGMGGAESLSSVFERLLSPRAVRVTGLRELPSEDVVPPAAPVAAGASAPAAVESTAGSAPLFRHRVELTVIGDAFALLGALRALDIGARPLRIERVRLQAEDSGGVRLVVTFTAVSTERIWLTT